MRVVALALMLALVTAACGSQGAVPRHASDSDPIAEALDPPIVVGPAAHVARAYNEPFAGSGTGSGSAAFADEVFARLAATHPDLVRDPRLDAACEELVAVAAQDAPLDDRVIEFALHEQGVVEPAQRAGTVWQRSAAAAADELAAQLDALGEARIGIAGVSPTVLVVTHRSAVNLAQTPREVPAHAEVVIAGVLDPRFHAPHLTISREDGSRDRERMAIDGVGAIRDTFSCGAHFGEQWVLVEACDVHDVLTRLALFPVSCGAPPIASLRVEPRRNTAIEDPAAAERRLASIINRERDALHLPRLRVDPRTTTAAHRYAEAMQRAKSVAHDLDGSRPPARLSALGLTAPVVLEATLQAGDLHRAAEILLDEPAYHALLANGAVTHVGIGIATDASHELYVAVELAQITPPIDEAAVARGVLARLTTALAPPKPLLVDDVLSRIARRHAAKLAMGWSDAALAPELAWDLGGAPFVKISMGLKVLVSTEFIEVGSLLPPADLRFDHIGLAVVQSARNGPLAGRVWVIVLYGMARWPPHQKIDPLPHT